MFKKVLAVFRRKPKTDHTAALQRAQQHALNPLSNDLPIEYTIWNDPRYRR